MNEKLMAFAEKVSLDEALQNKLKEKLKSLQTVDEQTIEKIINIAKEEGFELTKADFENSSKELSVEEMQAIAGSGGCFCAAFGQGGGDDLSCTCFPFGTGWVKGRKFISSQGGCTCAGAGVGATRRH